MKKELENLKKQGWLPIARTGTWTDMTGTPRTIDTNFLDNTVSLYHPNNPAFSEAAFCIGHPRHNSPSFGWAEKIKRVGEYLFAKPKQLKSEFVKAVKDGYYKYVSPKFRPDGSLKHIALLGAMPPGIKGLGNASESFAAYAEDAEGTEYYFAFHQKKDIQNTSLCENQNIKEESMFLKKQKEAKKPPQTLPEEIPEQTDAAFSEPVNPGNNQIVQDALERARIAEEKFSQYLAKQKENQCLAFAGQMVDTGIIAPVEKPGFVKFLIKQDDQEEICFSEGDGEETGMNFFKRFMQNRKPVVPLEPLGKPKARTRNDVDDIEFAEGEVTDEDRDLDDKARAIMKQENCNYETALRKAGGDV
jgi:hypothetical protein